MFRSTHSAMYIAIMIYLVVNCLLVSSASVPSATCRTSALNSRQESFLRLNNEVNRVSNIVKELSGANLSKDRILQLAAEGLCSEQTQNQDRAYLAANQAKQTVSRGGNSMDTLTQINGYIDQIIALFKELEAQPTTAKANSVSTAIAGIRVNAKPLNVKLMNNAGYHP